ncbi:MAG TPA: alpha/beta hydrolase [Candidatus Melainabacteria bacterium]|nr:alpha/beta hydrolase [Candidatus Melainabacteria bacterium]
MLLVRPNLVGLQGCTKEAKKVFKTLLMGKNTRERVFHANAFKLQPLSSESVESGRKFVLTPIAMNRTEEQAGNNFQSIRRMPWSARLSALSLVGILATASLMWASPQSFAAFAADQTFTKYDIVIAKHPNRTLKLDFARPRKGDGPFPLVVCIHGGGWSSGNRKQTRQQMVNLAKMGYASASIEYRLIKEAKFPAQINDSAQAINYLLDRAEKFKINPNKVALFGGSAGGHIALLLSEVQNDIDRKSLPLTPIHGHICASASVAGPTNLTKKFSPFIQGIVDSLFNEQDRANPAIIAKDRAMASPISFADEQDPPMFLLHGTKDEIVPFDQATDFMSVCREKNVNADLIAIEGAGHGGGGQMKDWQVGFAKLLKFLHEKLSA